MSANFYIYTQTVFQIGYVNDTSMLYVFIPLHIEEITTKQSSTLPSYFTHSNAGRGRAWILLVVRQSLITHKAV